MFKKLHVVSALLIIASMVLTAFAQPVAVQQTPDCSKPEVLCVGLVTDVGKVDDKSFNQSAWEALQKAEKELGAVVKYIETTDSKDYAKNISQFGDAKYDVIVTAGYALGEETVNSAAKYPNIKFIGIDQEQTKEVVNVVGLIFAEDQSGYLAGVLAAMMTKSKKVGAVLGTDAVPPVWRFGEGYRAGAKYVDAKIEVNIVYHSDVGFDKTFTDPEWGKTTALAMINNNFDVIFGAGGKTGNGALLACVEKKVMAIGVDTDQYVTLPEAQKALLSSAVKKITPGTYDLIVAAKANKFPKGNYYGDVGLAPFHDFDTQVNPDVRTKLDEIAKGLKDGKIKTEVTPAKPAK